MLPAAGTALPPLDKPRFTAAHIVRWMAAQQNWDRIHFDQAFCRDIAKLEAPVINGALKQHLIVQFLARALPGAWPWRVDYQFTGPDLVGQKLQVRGTTGVARMAGGHTFLDVQVQIFNLDREQCTTRGNAVLVLPRDGQPVLDALDLHGPEGLALPPETAAPDAALPAHVNARLGTELDMRESRYPLDLSRLRLFADAVMDLDPVHYDPAAPNPWGSVVAPPLYPLHGLEALPGTYPLGEAPDAQGREGVNEVGRDLGPQFGFSAAGGMNAGNRVQIHSLARVGERICARSALVGARRRTGPRGGDMIFFESLNRYSEAGGRPLLTERQAVVLRLV
jgi:acyl dehydratase